jgi:hypothetical protein
VPRVEHEAGHAADADAGGGRLVGPHRVAEVVAGEQGRGVVLLQAGFGGQPDEEVVVAQVGALGGVGAHQAFPHGIAAAAVVTEVQEPMDVEAVDGAGVGQSVVETCVGRERGDRPQARVDLLGRHPEVTPHPFGDRRRAAAGPGRIELEAAVPDGDGRAVLESVERGLEAALAEVAPGADDVRPDVDGDRGHGPTVENELTLRKDVPSRKLPT